MKVFQIIDYICFSDMTKNFPTVESTIGYFTPETLFVEAPDYVFEGWGYDPDETGDNRFIKPIPPEGWLYDDESGTFYKEPTEEAKQTTNETSSEETIKPTYEELYAIYLEYQKEKNQ